MSARVGQREIVAAVLGVPAVLAALTILAVEGYRLVSPRSILFTEPPAVSLADALQHREVEVAYALVRDGADPNQPLTFRDDALTGGRTVRISPLMLAVASHNRNAVMMLLSAGARADLPVNTEAACLAREVGEPDLETMINRDGGRTTTPPACRQRGTGGDPLLLKYVR